MPGNKLVISFIALQPWQVVSSHIGASINIHRAGLPQIAITMKAADEPAYLTVGTDVSAKYRGAFCEAKIKTVKRMVKVKVVLKGDSTSQVVQDDQVKGPLRVGSTVEVKSPEGVLSEAVISKLTDASWYTVVFDDGDEKTLRRTSLCLKGERHFAESETLDQLPLTNPEHFGTPVIGKKTNRGRRTSQAVADEDKESSSSEDEEDDRRRLSDELLGKVAYVQSSGSPTYLALVISPSCNDDLTVKKDQCLVRSFADSKFHTVARKDIHQLNIDSISKSEYSSKKGFEGAMHFLKTKVVPESWKMDMSEILESSSSDDDDDDGDKESEEEEKEPEVDQPDDEPDPEERDHFLQQLYKFMEDRGTPINKPPVLGYKDLNLFKLFRLVHQHGGCDNIESGSVWKQIYMDLGIPVLNSAASYNVKTAYRKYLYGFEEYCRSAGITFRTVHHNDPRPVVTPSEPQKAVKQEPSDAREPSGPPVTDKPAANEDDSEDENEKAHKGTSPRSLGRRRCTVTPVKVEQKEPPRLQKEEQQQQQQPPRRKEEREREKERERERDRDRERERERERERDRERERERDRDRDREREREREASEEEQRDRQEDDGRPEPPGKRRSRRFEESDKESEDEDQEEEEDDEDDDGDRSRTQERGENEEGGGDEDSEHSVTGTKVRVKYGRGKTQKIYEANIKNTETDDGEVLYLVHYYGWNVRYDEWVKADRIIWPVDKGGTKRKPKKKVKNKEDGDKEEDKQTKMGGAKRGRPPLKSTPPSASRSASKTPSNESRSGSKSSRQSDPSALPNGEVTPRRRTRRTSGMYDSDRGSNDSGNSSEDSESEEAPSEKKPDWTEGPDQAVAAKQEEEEEDEEDEEEEDEEEEEAEAEREGESAVETVPPAATAGPTATAAPTTMAADAELPSSPAEKPKAPETHDGREEAEEEPVVANVTTPMAAAAAAATAAVTTTNTTPSTPTTPLSVPVTPEPEEKLTPRSKARRGRPKEPGSETPTQPAVAAAPTSTPATPTALPEGDTPGSLPRPAKKPQEAPPSPPLGLSERPREPADSDTDSATEEVDTEEHTVNVSPLSSVAKRKATEQRSPDKRARLEPPKTLSPEKRLPETERRSEGASRGGVELLSSPTTAAVMMTAAKEAEAKMEMPSLTREVQAKPEAGVPSSVPSQDEHSSGRDEEMMPQIGPEELVCYEVDLDDLDEKEKPVSELLLPTSRVGEVKSQPPPPSSSSTSSSSSTLSSSSLSSHLPLSAMVTAGPQRAPAISSSASPPTSAASPESHSTKSESDVTIEVDGESQEGLGEAESMHGFDASASSSNSSLSLQERDTKDRGQKRLTDGNSSSASKKVKRNQKRSSATAKTEKNGTGHSSDSEDLPVTDPSNKLTPIKHSSIAKAQKQSRSPGTVSPNSKELDKDKHKDKQGFPSPRTYKWTFQHTELDNMTSAERISFLQEKLQEIRKYYMSLKSEVASIDRRRKRLKKKEREVSHTTASTSSSSDTGMSPSSASPTQNTVAVECR
ncbi:hypothetical protein ACEWY4_005560 [Coilia grayii]|uniref:ARID domain-containing protein n=1 Tax=Coilia grayii TaxID=363190 RepID=A0ABD1KIX7_9TELE